MSRPRKPKGRPVSGWVVLDKPTGIGSTQCVSRIKHLFNADKAGHAGTLDPLASGMLPIALGEATKTVPFVMDGRKTYRFTVTWGAQTTTDDLEGEVACRSDKRPTPEGIAAALADYVGEIEQTPPAFSAVKIGGERAYDLARAGETVEIQPRLVHIHSLELICANDDSASFEGECGKGAYVRALARDIGRDLGCFGHITALRRTSVGPFWEDDLVTMAELDGLAADQHSLDATLLSTGSALEGLSEIPVSNDLANRIRAGNPVLLRGREALTFAPLAYAVCGGELIATGAVEAGSFHPKRVFKRSAV